MKSFLKFLFVFGAILLLSAFLAPLLFRFLPFKFERIFNRLIMIFSIAAAFFFVRIGRETFIHYGMDWRSGSFKLFGKGFGLGALTLALLVSAEVFAGAAAWSPKPFHAGLYTGVLAKALLTGFVVGVIEEFFFRGFIYSWIKNRWRWPWILSVGMTSVFYSLIHFVSRNRPFIGPHPEFMDSLKLTTAPFMAFQMWPELWPHALGLFLFGIVLNLTSLRAGSLYPSIGLHAGCVFFVKSDALFVEFLEKQSIVWPGSAMVDGLAGWIFLLFLGIAAGFLFKNNKKAFLYQS